MERMIWRSPELATFSVYRYVYTVGGLTADDVLRSPTRITLIRIKSPMLQQIQNGTTLINPWGTSRWWRHTWNRFLHQVGLPT